MMHLLKNQRGFTLVELLVAMVIGMLVASGAYSVFFSTTRTARKQEQVSEIQQNLRVAMERITQDIRQAGFGLPEDGSSLSYSGGSWSTPVTVTNNNNAPDQITLLGLGYKIGTIYNVAAGSTTDVININPDYNGDDSISGYMEKRFASESTGKINDDYKNKFVDSSNSTRPNRIHLSIGGVEYLKATSYSTSSDYFIGVLPLASNKYGNNIPIYILQSVRYLIEGCYDTDGDNSFYPADSDESDFLCLKSQDYSELRGSGEVVVAEGIEDIQFAYGVDVSPRDGKIDYSASGYNSAAFESDPADDSSIVAVRVSIVARSKVPDQNDSSARPALEDRPAGTADKYVRRTLTKTIKLRNPRSGA